MSPLWEAIEVLERTPAEQLARPGRWCEDGRYCPAMVLIRHFFGTSESDDRPDAERIDALGMLLRVSALDDIVYTYDDAARELPYDSLERRARGKEAVLTRLRHRSRP